MTIYRRGRLVVSAFSSARRDERTRADNQEDEGSDSDPYGRGTRCCERLSPRMGWGGHPSRRRNARRIGMSRGSWRSNTRVSSFSSSIVGGNRGIGRGLITLCPATGRSIRRCQGLAGLAHQRIRLPLTRVLRTGRLGGCGSKRNGGAPRQLALILDRRQVTTSPTAVPHRHATVLLGVNRGCRSNRVSHAVEFRIDIGEAFSRPLVRNGC